MLGSGKIHYEIGGPGEVMSYGGIGAMHRLVTQLGLPKQIDKDLHLLKVHLPYHESDHVLNLAYNVLCGGTRLEDIERLRHDVAYMNALDAELIPDPTTAGDFCRRFGEADVIQLMESINAVRAKLWVGRGRELLGPVSFIDVDGTLAPTCGKKKAGMDISYKGIWGYAPLIISLGNTKEPLYLVNRPGNVPSHTDAAPWIDRAIDHVVPYTERVCVRGDTDFSLTKHFDEWAEKVDFIFGMDANAALCSRAEALDEAAWRRLERKPRYETLTDQKRHRYQADEKRRIVRERKYLNLELNYEDVAEFEYQPGKCRRPYRVVALRKNISKMKGDNVLFDEIRYFFYITTRTDLSAAEVVRCANERCDQENVIEQLKNGVNALRVPLYDLVSNWAYMVIAALAWTIKSWFAMMMHRKRDRAEYIAMEFPPLPPQHDPDPVPCDAASTKYHAAAPGLPIHHRPLLQYRAHDREDGLWVALTPPTLPSPRVTSGSSGEVSSQAGAMAPTEPLRSTTIASKPASRARTAPGSHLYRAPYTRNSRPGPYASTLAYLRASRTLFSTCRPSSHWFVPFQVDCLEVLTSCVVGRRPTTHNKYVSGSAHFVRSDLHGLERSGIVSCQLNFEVSAKMSV